MSENLSSKNECAKTRPRNDPYEVWATPIGDYLVLKKYKSPRGEAADPYARWLTYCNGDMGDMYAAEIKKWGVRVK